MYKMYTYCLVIIDFSSSLSIALIEFELNFQVSRYVKNSNKTCAGSRIRDAFTNDAPIFYTFIEPNNLIIPIYFNTFIISLRYLL